MLKKGDDNTTKSECKSNFTSEIRKIRQMARELGVSIKISIGKMGIGKLSIKSKVKIKSIKSVDKVIKKHYT